MGTATFVVDLAADTVSFDIIYGGLSSGEVTAHIHGPGALVSLQTWYRDPASSFGSGLSDALLFSLQP